MTMSSFELELIRKGDQALKSARILREHDFEGSVNRSYYAMFNFARVTLLSVGVPEHDLPRTHGGVIAAFSRHAVQSGRIDPGLAAALGRTETLRLRADYTGKPIDAKTATDTLALAEAFVATVRREFALQESATTRGLESKNPGRGDKISEPGNAAVQLGSGYPPGQPFALEPFSLEEVRREARENWLRLRQQKREAALDAGQDLDHAQEP